MAISNELKRVQAIEDRHLTRSSTPLEGQLRADMIDLCMLVRLLEHQRNVIQKHYAEESARLHAECQLLSKFATRRCTCKSEKLHMCPVHLIVPKDPQIDS